METIINILAILGAIISLIGAIATKNTSAAYGWGSAVIWIILYVSKDRD